MANTYTQGFQLPEDLRAVIPDTYIGIAQNWFVNRTVLAARFPKLPIPTDIFQMVGYQFRPRTLTLTGGASAGALTTGDTTLTFSSTKYLNVGDVIQLSTDEAVEVLTIPSSTSVTVARGIGTDAANGSFTHTAATGIATIDSTNNAATIVGNSRTGAEVDQTGFEQVPGTATQYVQSMQQIVQVGGKTQAMAQAIPLPPGVASPFDKNKLDAMQNFMDDLEYAGLYGVGESPSDAASKRGKMYGIVNLLATNKTTSPTNASAYKPVDFQRDTINKIVANGGRCGMIMVSNEFLEGLATWGQSAVRIPAGSSAFGVAIDMYSTPLFPNVPLVHNMWLKPYTALALTTEEVRWRYIRTLDYLPYGIRGDAVEGEWHGDYAIEVDNEAHHAYVSGITGWAPAV